MAHYDIDIFIVHVTGITNCTADHLSRQRMSLFFSLNPQANVTPTALPSALMDIVASPSLDWTSPAFRQLFNTITEGLAVSTHKCYQTGQLRYLSFCRQLSINPVPTTERTLLLSTTYLAKEGLAYTSIKVYISAIRNMHITLGHHHSYSQQLTPYLEQVLQGIQLRSNPQRKRLPITVDIMLCIHAVLVRSKQNYNSIMMWAACCLAFFGLLRFSQ